jgi:hypothetical protein
MDGEAIASSQVIQRDARNSWSSTQLWPTRGVTNTAQDNSVLDTAFVLIDAFSLVCRGVSRFGQTDDKDPLKINRRVGTGIACSLVE